MDITNIAAQYSIGGISVLFVNGILVKAIRMTGMPSKWLPLMSLIIGMALGLLWAYASAQSLINGSMAGIVLGAATSGYYDIVKKPSEESNEIKAA